MSINITIDDKDRSNLEATVDEEIKDFEAWFMTLGNTGGLTRVEIAILKTYLGYKLGVHKGRG